MLSKRVLCIMLSTVLFSDFAYACRCKEIPLESAYKRADLAVYAKVLETAKLIGDEGNIAILKINSSWKLQSNKMIGVISTTNCNFNLVKSKEYILFLKTEDFGLYYTDKCSGNSVSTQKQTLIKWLNKKSSSNN